MKVWMRGRCASGSPPRRRRCRPCGYGRGRISTGPSTVAGDRLDRLEVAGRGDREAGLDHVDAEPRQLLRDLDLLGRVQRDPGRLLAVAQRRVEDVDAVCVVCWDFPWSYLLLHFDSNDLVSRGSRAAQRYSPRRGRRRRSARLSSRCVIRCAELSARPAPSCAHESARRKSPPPWLALLAMGISVVVIANDFSAINVALPTMEQDFAPTSTRCSG